MKKEEKEVVVVVVVAAAVTTIVTSLKLPIELTLSTSLLNVLDAFATQPVGSYRIVKPLLIILNLLLPDLP